MHRHPDRITQFSHRLAQIKFIILEIVIFIGFLLWLWDKVKHDFHLSSGAPPTIEVSDQASLEPSASHPRKIKEK